MNRKMPCLEMSKLRILRFMVPMHSKNERRLSMNRPFGVPALAGSDRLKAGLQTNGVRRTGSWSQCMRKNERGLSMNRGSVLVVLLVLVLD